MTEISRANSELLAGLIANHKEFISTAKSIAPAKMQVSPKPGEWSPAFVLHHMADAELHFATRYLFNIADDLPTIVPFNEDVYPERVNYAKRDPLASLAAIEGVSQMVIDILKVIPGADWSRTSIHSEKGPVTLSQIVELASGHSKAHANQIKEIIASL
jgi:hypothetical protein